MPDVTFNDLVTASEIIKKHAETVEDEDDARYMLELAARFDEATSGEDGLADWPE